MKSILFKSVDRNPFESKMRAAGRIVGNMYLTMTFYMYMPLYMFMVYQYVADFEYVSDFEQMRTALDFWLLIFDTMISYSISG